MSIQPQLIEAAGIDDALTNPIKRRMNVGRTVPLDPDGAGTATPALPALQGIVTADFVNRKAILVTWEIGRLKIHRKATLSGRQEKQQRLRGAQRRSLVIFPFLYSTGSLHDVTRRYK
jgi:hypothetical protein